MSGSTNMDLLEHQFRADAMVLAGYYRQLGSSKRRLDVGPSWLQPGFVHARCLTYKQQWMLGTPSSVSVRRGTYDTSGNEPRDLF